MNIVTAGTLFAVIILIYWIIWELFSMLFRFTGFPDDKARFQVLSLLTGCGFTTRESESLLAAKPRRRLTQVTMLFGYVFNITIVTAFINVFLSLKINQVQNYYFGILIPLVAVAIIFIFMRVPRVRAWGDGILQHVADRIIGVEKTFNSILLLDYIGTESIALLTLNYIPEEYRGVKLSETGLKSDTGILVMLVEKPGKKAEPAGAETVFDVGDKLTVFGDYATICRTFHAREHFTEG